MRKSLVLKKHQVFELVPTAPFSFDPTFHKPAHYPTSDTAWEPGIRWQTMLWFASAKATADKPTSTKVATDKQGKCLGLKFENAGTVRKPKIKLHVFSEKDLPNDYLDSLIEEIRYRYDLDSDLAEFSKKFENDKQLGPIIKKWPGMRPMSPQSLYEYLVIGVMLQNCTVRRSINMTQALFENYGTLLKYDKKEFYCFWPPKALDKVSEEELRALKIGYRAKALKRITEPFAKGEIDELELRKKTREEQREALINLYGIGPATVGYILFDVFKDYADIKHISPWEQKIYSKLFFDRDPEKPVPVEKLLKHFKKYGKYQQLAVHYIWEDIWWKRKNKNIPWLEKLVRV